MARLRTESTLTLLGSYFGRPDHRIITINGEVNKVEGSTTQWRAFAAHAVTLLEARRSHFWCSLKCSRPAKHSNSQHSHHAIANRSQMIASPTHRLTLAYICIHARIHARTGTCMHTHTHIHAHIHAHMHAHRHAHRHAHIHAHMHAQRHAHRHAHIHAHRHAPGTRSGTHARTHVRTHTHARTHTHTHTHAHTHTCTHLHAFAQCLRVRTDTHAHARTYSRLRTRLCT